MTISKGLSTFKGKVLAGAIGLVASVGVLAAPTCTDTTATSVCNFVDNAVVTYFADIKAGIFNVATSYMGIVVLLVAIGIIVSLVMRRR